MPWGEPPCASLGCRNSRSIAAIAESRSGPILGVHRARKNGEPAMMPAEFDVTGKVVLITGAGRGIGKGIAQVLAEAGADIALNALTPRYVEGATPEIAAASGRRVFPFIADVTKADDVRRAVDRVLAEFGRIDVLVNAL